MDQTLDIIVDADLGKWRWKDEHELDQAVALGAYTPEQASDIRAAGESALEHFLARKPPFDREWDSWRRPKDWPIPTLPEGWDVVE
jgi:hypothetical protein